jgi:BlaI family penicillinase repressor
MDQVWENQPISVRDIVDKINETDKKAYTTVQTYMENLVKKGVLTKKKIGLVNFYSSTITKDSLLSKESNSFLNRGFNGSFSNFASFLFKKDKLSKKDVEDLKKLIDEAHDD